MANRNQSRAKALKANDGAGLDRFVTAIALAATVALILLSPLTS